MREPLRRSGLVAFLMCAVMAAAVPCAIAQENSVPENPTLTVRITPPKPYLQEEIVQVIRVIARHPFEELVLDLPTVEGAEIITLQQPKNRKFSTYGGEGYIFETSRAIFPKQSGELEIPTVRVSGSVGVSRNEKEPFALRSEATILDVRPPPTAFSEDWWLIARDIKIDQAWSEPLDDIRVGDRVTRSITVTAAGVTGAHLPELEQGRSQGLTVLPGQTERRTEITPAGVIGTIRRSFEIRVDVDQPINISPVRVVWWNTSTEIERQTATPSVRLEPLPRDVDGLVAELMTEAAAAHERSRSGITAITLGATALLIALAYWLMRMRRKTRPEDSTLQQALMLDDSPLHAVQALTVWAKTAFPDNPAMTLEHLGKKLGPEARQRIETLQAFAYGERTEVVAPASLVTDIVRIAQDSRRQPMRDMMAGLLDSLLGPERRLPEIGQRPR